MSITLAHPSKTTQILPPFAVSVYEGPLKQRSGFYPTCPGPTSAFSFGEFLSPSINFITTFTAFSHLARIFSLKARA
jgi:hypothetical protein